MVNCWLLHRWQLHLVVILYGVGVSHIFGLQSEAFQARRRLIEKLTADSEITKQILPVLNKTSPVRLGIEVTLRQIADVDEVNQAIRLTIWLRLLWNNPFLTWKPIDFDNITSMNIKQESLWKPDIAIYNKASLEEDVDILYKRLCTAIIVGHNGDCRWLAPATLHSQCRIDVTDFPFDEQLCLITFGSWTYPEHEIDVYAPKKHTYLKDFIPNGEWKVVEATLKRNVKPYPGNVSYPEVTMYLRIKRKSLYFTSNLIIPCTMIAILALMSFILPSQHGERISLVIMILLTMTVYMLIISSILPQTSDAVPIIAVYFLCLIVLISLCLFATCLIASLRGQEHDIPKWIDVVVNIWLARYLLVKCGKSVDQDVAKTDTIIKLHNRESEGGESTSYTLETLSVVKTKLNASADQSDSALAILVDDVVRRQKKDVKLEKWRKAAEVLDRFFLLFFSVSFVILIAVIFG